MGTEIDGYMVEDDTLTGDDVQEETLEAVKIPFSDPSFTSDNIKEAIIEAKAGGSGIGGGLLYGELDQDIDIPSDRAIVMVNPHINQYTIRVSGTWRIE